jgi:putative inorganic carbon (HCO3(-)) transporter
VSSPNVGRYASEDLHASPPVNSPVVLPLERSGFAWSRWRPLLLTALGLVLVCCVAAATVSSPQLGCTVALVLMAVTAYVAHPRAGVAALVLVWITVPFIRRVLGLELGYLAEDPLSVAPFVATGALAVLAAGRMRLPRPLIAVLAAVAAGMLFGLPAAADRPSAAVYSLLAYLGACSAVLLGWREGREPLDRWTLVRMLIIAAPILGAYSLYQYFVELPSWDRNWLSNVRFTSIEAPEEGKIRSFASLNSPGLLGFVLALSILLYTGRQQLERWQTVAIAIAAGGLAVTYVRSAWLALVVGAVVLLFASGLRAAPRIGRLALLLGLAVLVLSASASTYTAFLDRIGTFGSLSQDQSARARSATPLEALPDLARRPLGYGLGSAGESTRLSAGAGLQAPDNGYLAMAWQLGFVGGLLVVGALLAALATGVRAAFARRDPERALIAALCAFLLVALAAGDQFYGFAGVVLWYLTGAVLSRSRAPASPSYPLLRVT